LEKFHSQLIGTAKETRNAYTHNPIPSQCQSYSISMAEPISAKTIVQSSKPQAL